MTKSELRERFIERRLALSQVEYEYLCVKVFEQFRNLDLAGIKCIHLFLPIRKRKEPDTLLIRDWLKANHSQIKLVYPKTNFADNTMQSYADDADLQRAISSFGVDEPVAGNIVDAKEIDLIIVPLLAFDRQGYRVGYGKGFYDRFIATCKPGVQLIGMSFFEAVERIEDINEFDKKLTGCIMPGGYMSFQG